MKNLSDKQLIAINNMIQGKTDTDTAKEIGVSRTTIHIWKTQNDSFIAELNASRETMRNEIQDKIQATTLKAYRVLDKALDAELQKENPNPKIAMEIIKSYKKPTNKLLTTVKEIENDRAFSELLDFDVQEPVFEVDL